MLLSFFVDTLIKTCFASFYPVGFNHPLRVCGFWRTRFFHKKSRPGKSGRRHTRNSWFTGLFKIMSGLFIKLHAFTPAFAIKQSFLF